MTDIIISVLGEDLILNELEIGGEAVVLSPTAQGFMIMLSWTCFLMFLALVVNIFQLIVNMFRGD